MRRQIVPLIAVASLLSLMVVDRCASCAGGTVTQNGNAIDIADVAGWSALVIFTALALWTCVLAGILASDHLAETLSDGSFALSLSRPVGRGTYALARLAGAFAIAAATGALLLGGTTSLLAARHGLPLGPALWALVACWLGCVAVGALSMACSLLVPRPVTALLVLGGVGSVAALNTLAFFGAELEGGAALVERYGPPLGSAVAVALAPWVGSPAAAAGAPALLLRLLAWSAAGVGLLVWGVRRIELR